MTEIQIQVIVSLGFLLSTGHLLALVLIAKGLWRMIELDEKWHQANDTPI